VSFVGFITIVFELLVRKRFNLREKKKVNDREYCIKKNLMKKTYQI
jgi:hypothetical protein